MTAPVSPENALPVLFEKRKIGLDLLGLPTSRHQFSTSSRLFAPIEAAETAP